MENIQSIIEKISNLRKLSTSSNANEAAVAAAMADKLIAKYRLSEAELEIKEEKFSQPEFDDGFVYETKRITKWKNSLILFISKHYGCAVYNSIGYDNNSGRSISRYKLVGSKEDMSIVKYMFSWLTGEIERLCHKESKGKGHIYSNSFCIGAVSGIVQQMNLSKKEVASTVTNSTALARVDNKFETANSFMNNNLKLGKSKTTSNSSQIDYTAYNKGIEVGKNIHLGKVIGNDSTTKFLK